jgi:Family of unknown function (DUF5681)
MTNHIHFVKERPPILLSYEQKGNFLVAPRPEICPNRQERTRRLVMDRQGRDPEHPNRWAQGESGNAAGRPRGSRNKRSEAEALLDGNAENLARTAIDKALGGDIAALRLCLARIAAPARRTVEFALPRVEKIADLPLAYRALLDATAEGTLAAAEAESLAAVLDGQRRAFETTELEARVKELELATGVAPPGLSG